MSNLKLQLADIVIQEPVTVLTDLLVSFICLYAWGQLKMRRQGRRFEIPFELYFLFMSLATFVGGVIGHGFLYALSYEWKLPGWLLSMISINMLERAMILYNQPILKPKVGHLFTQINALELILMSLATCIFLNFKIVEVHSAYGLIGVVNAFVIYRTIKRGWSKSGILYLSAIGLAIAAGLIFIFKIGISESFTHFDLSHVFMGISAYVFYRGTKLIYEENPKS